MRELRILDDKYGVADYLCLCVDCNIQYTIKRAAVPELLSIGRCPNCYRLETFRLDFGPNIYTIDILKAPSTVQIRQAKTLLFYDQITRTIARIGAPMTVRQLFYQMSTRNFGQKSEKGYGQVQRAAVDIRKTGILPHWVFADHTRWRRKPQTNKGLAEAMSFWHAAPIRTSAKRWIRRRHQSRPSVPLSRPTLPSQGQLRMLQLMPAPQHCASGLPFREKIQSNH